MYRLSKKERANRPIHKLLNQGFVFAIVGANGAVLKPSRYKLELTGFLKIYPGSSIVEIKSLLKGD